MLNLFVLDECEDFVVIPIVVVLSSWTSAIGPSFEPLAFDLLSFLVKLRLNVPISDEFMLHYCDCRMDTCECAMQNFYARERQKILRCCANFF
jgi:hypothetical protein